MKHLKEKIHILYLPFLIIGVLFISSYTFFNWRFVILSNPFNLSEDTVNVWLPMIPLLCIFIIKYWPLKKLIKKRDYRSKPFLAILMIGTLAVLPANFIAQLYITSLTGKLTVLKDVNGLSSLTKYYQLKSYYLNDTIVGTYTSLITKNKGKDLNISFYMCCPIYSSKSDTIIGRIIDFNSTKIGIINGDVIAASHKLKKKTDTVYLDPPKQIETVNAKAWFAVNYDTTISNRLSIREEENAKQVFYKTSIVAFRNACKQPINYFDRIGFNHQFKKYTSAIEHIASVDAKKPFIVLEPRHEPFEKRLGNKLMWIWGAFSIGAMVFLLLILFLQLDDEKLHDYLNRNNIS